MATLYNPRSVVDEVAWPLESDAQNRIYEYITRYPQTKGSRKGVVDNMKEAKSTPGPKVVEILVPPTLHPDTVDLVRGFATALAARLDKAQLKYGYNTNWARGDWKNACKIRFQDRIVKGDPRDVAAYCAFMWHHGWTTTPAESGPRTYRDSITDSIYGMRMKKTPLIKIVDIISVGTTTTANNAYSLE